MAITSAELNYYRSKTVNDTNSNGGRISTTEQLSGLTNSWWPNFTDTQLSTGGTWWRKGFLRIDNASDDVAYNVRIGLWKAMPEDDSMYLAEGTQTDIQSDLAAPDLYGAGALTNSVTAGDDEIDVTVDDGTVINFRDGDLIRISDQATVGGAGNAEYHYIDGDPVIVGDVVTITLATQLANDYSNADTFVSCIIEAGTVTGTTTDKSVTSASGTFDATKMTVGNLGSIYQVVTFTFTSATAFTVTSDEVVFSPNTGTILATYAPTNVPVGASYFSVPATAWGGVWADGDTLEITTVPPCVPIWEKRVLPAASSSVSLETRTLMFFAES